MGLFSQGGAGAASSPPPPPPPPPSVIGIDPATGHPTIKGFTPPAAAKPAEAAKPAQPGMTKEAQGIKTAVGGLYPFNILGQPGPAPDAKP